MALFPFMYKAEVIDISEKTIQDRDSPLFTQDGKKVCLKAD